MENDGGRNLVAVAGGLNDVLIRKGTGLPQRLAKGGYDLREVYPREKIVVCMVVDVQLRDSNEQRAVLTANGAI